MISIIIRAKNEEQWIGQCLKRILAQTMQDYEVVLVDNNSRDRTVPKALSIMPDLKVVTIDEYLPGKALNLGVRHSTGDLAACLSAHCLPLHEDWLEMLARNLENPQVAGVYGRQSPMNFTPAPDKRDLINTFGLDPRIQWKDSFFHNANSMIRRSVWEEIPFDETMSNIEDRYWAQCVQKAGYAVAYEPEAPVSHHHGIYQNGHEGRCKGVVQILENMFEDLEEKERLPTPNSDEFDLVGVVAVETRGASDSVFAHELLEHTLASLRESRHLTEIIFAVDDPDLGARYDIEGVRVLLRPAELSAYGVRGDAVLRHILEVLEQEGRYPDLIAPLEITYPMRPPGIVDHLIETLFVQGLDTVITGFAEYRPCWIKENDQLVQISSTDRPRREREPLLVGLPNLGCVTRPHCLRQGSRIGRNVGVVEVHNPLYTLEIRSVTDIERYRRLLASGVLRRGTVEGAHWPKPREKKSNPVLDKFQ